MNSPLEIREVRLRGLPRRGRLLYSALGLDGSMTASVHSDGVRHELSAQADIAVS